MDRTPNQKQSAFSIWIRTGRVPIDDRVELKFNPWHDPSDGRFTFAGSGRNYGAGGADPVRRSSGASARIVRRDPPPAAATLKAEVRRGEPPARRSKNLGDHEAIAARRKLAESRPGDLPNRPPNPVAELVGGVGEGLYDVAAGTVTTAYSALTTNPITTVRNVGLGIAGMIDTAIAAEDMP